MWRSAHTHADGCVCPRPACPTYFAQRRWSTDFRHIVSETCSGQICSDRKCSRGRPLRYRPWQAVRLTCRSSCQFLSFLRTARIGESGAIDTCWKALKLTACASGCVLEGAGTWQMVEACMRRAGVGIRHVVPDTPPSNISPASIANCLPHTCPVTPSTTSITNGMCLSVPHALPNRLPTTSTTNGMSLPIPHMLPTFLSPASITSGMSLSAPHILPNPVCPTGAVHTAGRHALPP